ncbi:mechanosensitive ion channel domain-containing protein [Roseibium sp.]|uniref:mechanosensitive ion channel domain-containing protein n=1 Tax=Roseibium sp. TaxID=1936156 RepID=UPI003A976BD5
MNLTFRLRAVLFLFLTLPFLVAPATAQVPPLAGSATTSSSQSQEAGADKSSDGEVSLDAASEALIRVLQDPASRDALIDRLKNLPLADAANETSENAPAEPASDATAAEEDQTFAMRLGQYTRRIVGDASQAVDRVGHELNGFVLLLNGDVEVRWDRARQAAVELVVVLVAAVAVFAVGQMLLRRVVRNQMASARNNGIISRVVLLIVTTLSDVATVVVGWGAGYAAALLSFGMLEDGVSLLESLALNAFLLTGLAKVAIRLAFAPERAPLRFLPFKDDTARYWAGRLGFLVSWLGYGLMLGVPLANMTVSFVLGNAVRLVIVLLGGLFLVVLVNRNHARVAQGVRDYSRTLSSEVAQRALWSLANFWHLVAYAYVLMALAIWISRPYDAASIIIRATGYSMLTVLGGFFLSFVMTRAIRGGIRLPESMRESLPALETRLNAFVPRILKIFRLLVFIGTTLLLLGIWGIIDLDEWLQSPLGLELLGRYGSAGLVLLAAFAIWLAVMSWIDLRLREEVGYIVTARVRTLFQLFRNAFTVIVIVMASLLALSEIGVDIGPLIAGAGVVGLAISFGAQTLVKDIITGAFIQIENAINEGDVVTVGGITGSVERLTVRSVRLRDVEGTTHIVPFSSVDLVSNFMRDFAYHVALIGVAYDTDVKKAKFAMEQAFLRLRASELGSEILDDLEMNGVVNLGESSVDIRARIKTVPGSQWKVGRAYNEYVKEVFDELGIEIPFPQVTYHSATPIDAPVNPPKKRRNEQGEEESGNDEAEAGGASSDPDGGPQD